MTQENHAAASRNGKTKIVFVADNRNRENWGCRATSIALKDIIKEQCEISYTIYGDITGWYAPVHFYRNTLKTRLYSILYRSSGLAKNIFRLFDAADIIRSTVDKSYSLYQKAIKKNRSLQEIDEKIKQADAMVVNGEGTFIFSTPNRYDTIMYLLLIKVAQSYGKRTYCLNAMFSDYPNSPRNLSVINEAKEILGSCTFVTARDPISLRYCKENITDHVKYVPDALFTWNKFGNYQNVLKDYPLTIMGFPEKENKWMDFKEPYLCLSGSSLAARYPQKAYKAYCILAERLNERMRTVVVSTCSGDKFLQNVAEKLNLPYVSVNSNILTGMALLSNARAFVSGRWHPSILASIGGTPCVFMGSNSHKTLAIQKMLNYEKQIEYNAIPSKEEINDILEDTVRVISQGEILRDKIKTVACGLAQKAYEGNKL